jgi:preprotein translocase subunit SecA
MLNTIKFIKKIFKSDNEKDLDRLKSLVMKINHYEDQVKRISDDHFPSKTLEFKQRIQKGEVLASLLPEAFALVREAAFRTLNERHFDVQLMGGIALHENNIAEMKTGEGKTLVSTLPAYLNSLEEKGVHIVTVNDYLAQRDSEWMGKIYNFLGLQVGCIMNNLDDYDRKKNYNCDITYGTNSEFGFDYLRDNMKFSISDAVQRDHNFCIVDEVDSILIDEARTPLIISGATEDKSTKYLAIDKFIKQLNKTDFEIDEKDKNVMLTDKGTDNVEKIFSNAGILKHNNFYDPENMNLVHLVNQCLRANHLFSKDKDYIVSNNEIKIVDEFTGRILEGRRFSDGLHQALEAKENVDILSENETLASITYQNYFRLYKKLSGMTGTASTEAAEFFDIYNLRIVSIPTHKPMIRKDWNDQIYRTENEKHNAITNKILECYRRGQPVLVGTTSIEKSELYSSMLKKKNIKHAVLNAKLHEKEANIIAEAGRLNSITIATNMAGRGVDIQLGGKQNNLGNTQSNDGTIEEKNKIKQLGGLFVIGTERHESRRIDNQLRGRSGRQGDLGNSIFYISLQDDLMRIFGSESIDNMLKKFGLKENESIDHPWINKALERAQQKVEARNYDIRKTLLKFDDVVNDQRKVIFSQRKEILSSASLNNVTNNFLNELIDQIIEDKKILKKDPKNKSIYIKIKSLLGRSVNEEEINNLISINNENFRKFIEEKFTQQRLKRIELINDKQNNELERRIFIQTLDMNCKSHLQYLEQLRQVIGLRGYGQRDPLIEYKKEAFSLFEKLLEKIKNDTISILNNLVIVEKPTEVHQESGKNSNVNKINIANNPDCLLLAKKSQKISRNERCPVTNKKFKHCCGAL